MLLSTLLVVMMGVVAAYNDDVYMEGDVVVGGLFAVQDNNGDSCSEVSPSSIQEYEAVRWFFTQLNNRDYIQNVKLGFHAFKTCTLESKAVKSSLRFIDNDKEMLGVIGPGTSSEAQGVSRLLNSLPGEDSLPQIVFSATAATLSDRKLYNNLYRVIVSDNVQVDVILQLLLSLKWNYIAIVYDNDAYGTEASHALKELAEKHDICVPVFTAINSSSKSYDPVESFRSVAREIERRDGLTGSPVLGIVFIGQAPTAEDMFKYLDISLVRTQIIASESIRESSQYLQDGNTVYSRAKGLLTSSPHVHNPEKFREYWETIHMNGSALLQAVENNTWLREYMEEVTGCSLDQVNTVQSNCLRASTKSVQDNQLSLYVGYALMAAATLAKSFKTVYESRCPDQTGLCSALKSLPDNQHYFNAIKTTEVAPDKDFIEMTGIPYVFRFMDGEIQIEDQNFSAYGIYNYRLIAEGGTQISFVKVGDFINNNTLSLTPADIRSYTKTGDEVEGAVEAQCQETYECSFCETEPVTGDILYIPGDYYVVGLTPIHNKGDNSYTCGELRETVSVDIAEGYSFAVKTINAREGIFKSVLGDKKLGLVLMDTCNTPFLTRERVIKLLRGELQVTDNVTSSQLLGKIIGFVGPYASANSVPLSSIMTETDFLYISYASTSTRLSDRSNFPNFMRTCAPDSKQADAIMNIASSIGAKYVQIIHTDEEYGTAGKDALVAAAKVYKVCVAQTLVVEDTTDSAVFRGYVSDLRKFRHARIIIIFARSHVTPKLLSVLNDEIEMNEFVFIGGESWGKRAEVLVDNPKLRGSLTLAQELPLVEGFVEYFRNINIESTENPWLQKFLELRSTCFFPMSYNKKSRSLCPPNLINETKEFDTWIPFASYGVFSLVLGFQNALEAKCPGSNSVCADYTTKDLIKYVKEVHLDIYQTGKPVPVFDDNGEGLVGYVISHVIREGGKLVYKEVGSSENGFSLNSLQANDQVNYQSVCPNDRECDACKQQLDNGQPSSSDNSIITALGVTLGVMILITIAMGVLLCYCRRKQKSLEDPYLTVLPDKINDYLTARTNPNTNETKFH